MRPGNEKAGVDQETPRIAKPVWIRIKEKRKPPEISELGNKLNSNVIFERFFW